jgi:CheY-like chemotaxis protein
VKPIHILLVEDNEGDIVLTTEALNEGKITNTIAVVKDGWEAILYLEKEGKYEGEKIPDLILLDINLPKMNGHEVLQHIKSNNKLKHIPVIMLTTSSAEKDIFQSYQHHANCYITKPVEVDEFLKVVTTIEDFWITIVQLPNKIHH